MKMSIRMNIILIPLFIFLLYYTNEAQIILSTLSQSNASGISSSNHSNLISIMGQSTSIGSTRSGYLNISSGSIHAATLDLIPPNIILQSINPLSPEINQAIDITAVIEDFTGVSDAFLGYRKGGDKYFTELIMQKTGLFFETQIPAAAVTNHGVELYITSSDYSGNVARFPTTGIFSIQISVTGKGIVNPRAQPGGTSQTAYRLISIPLDANNKSPGAIFEDDLGTYDITKWRLFELRTNQTYAEYTFISNIIPGKAYWLIVKDTKVIDSGPGKTVSTATPYAVHLNPGWTFIGNPFNFSIPLTNLSRKSGGTLDMRSYNGSWASHNTALIPFEGYAISNLNGDIDTLLINPNLGGILPKPALEKPDDVLWNIRIIGKIKDAEDNDNEIVASNCAKVAYDNMDKPEPPIIGEYISIYFPHPEWKKPLDKFCVDARPNPVEGNVWEFEIVSNILDVVHLKFEGIENLPPEIDVVLIDKILKTTQKLRQINCYSYTNLSRYLPRKMSILAGNRSYVDNKLSELESTPSKFELRQNFPNPFNPVTVISYELPIDSRVTLRIYNTLCQEVKTLVNEFQVSGYKSVEWNSTNNSGNLVSSGVYLYRIDAAGVSEPSKTFMQVKKMLLLK